MTCCADPECPHAAALLVLAEQLAQLRIELAPLVAVIERVQQAPPAGPLGMLKLLQGGA